MAEDHDAITQDPTTPHYDGAAGGWGSMRGMAGLIADTPPQPAALAQLRTQNKTGGVMCTSCAWAKPADPHTVEFCENGAKATIWDFARARCDAEVLEAHTVDDLLLLSDHELEALGRLMRPMRFDPETRRYRASNWDTAFAEIGAALRGADPKATVCYTSGRASLETSYMWQLFARLHGHNNLPDSSNMCHETTGKALKEFIGVPVGTVTLDDFEDCDLLMFFGQNPGTNSPRMLHLLQKAAERGCAIVAFNPIREAGLIRFRNPQQVRQMLGGSTEIADLYLQLRPGGDIAALAGMMKEVLRLEETEGGTLDGSFIAAHTEGFEALRAWLDAQEWDAIEAESGLPRRYLEEVGRLYARSKAVIAVYGMGLTQHVKGGETIGALIDLLLMRGNIGKLGAGICPVRGHSNVQGQRTVGIADDPKLVPLDKIGARYGFAPPREKGITTVEVVEGVLAGRVRAFLQLGGNFARAIPDDRRAMPAWAGLDLQVHVATRLNRSHLLACPNTWLLPTLVRGEAHEGREGPQWLSVEDSLSHIHGSFGDAAPAGPLLLSEPQIVAGIAAATLGEDSVPWTDWALDLRRVRAEISAIWPDEFSDYEAGMREPGGFYRGNSARARDWQTESGKAQFSVPERLSGLSRPLVPDECTLITVRSNDQFNTTVYGHSDRLRGLKGDRMILLMAPEEIEAQGLSDGAKVTVECAHDDGIARSVGGLTLTAYDLPRSCVAGYFPELNALIPLSLHEEMSKTPAYKGVPVRIIAE